MAWFRLSPWVVALSLGMAHAAEAAPCDVTHYRPQPGLTAESAANRVTLLWNGDAGQELRLSLSYNQGQPVVDDLAIRTAGTPWRTIVQGAVPEFAVTTALRRMSRQQLEPLNGLGVPITQAVVDRYRWDPFWDAPLDFQPVNSKGRKGLGPPVEDIKGTDQPGLPRSPNEVSSATAQYQIKACSITTDGARLMVKLSGVTLGSFQGALHYTIFRGSNLIRQEVIASTQQKWVAYHYRAGLGQLSVTPEMTLNWRDTHDAWHVDQASQVALSPELVPLKAGYHVLTAGLGEAALSVFPEPHKFFWAREVAINMGYNYYRHDPNGHLAIGVRQNEHEDDSENQANWALYSARPGTLQRMAVYLYPSLGAATGNAARVLDFTHHDHYMPLAGYQVMGHHYHTDIGDRVLAAKSANAPIPDLMALKALGINIASAVDSIRLEGFERPGQTPPLLPATTEPVSLQVKTIAAAVAGAKANSDAHFVVMPNQEVFSSPFGGHTDVLFSHPVYWDQRRVGQASMEVSAQYGKIYHIANADDLMAMTHEEGALLTMPHPRTKGSTGYPEAIKDQPYFLSSDFDGAGMRWGMGLDGSEERLCDYRCWPLLDEMSNWQAQRHLPMKHIIAISELRHVQPGDDIYASEPVSYVKLATVPSVDNAKPLLDALRAGDSFWTTGEVLIHNLSVNGKGRSTAIIAELDWTFPLQFIELTWGDGQHIWHKRMPTPELTAFGHQKFSIPLDLSHARWVRLEAWDNAANGAVSQSIAVNGR